MPSVWREVPASVLTCNTTPAMVLVSLYLLLLPGLLQSVCKQQPHGTPSARETPETHYTGMEQHPAGRIYLRLPFGFGDKLFGRIH